MIAILPLVSHRKFGGSAISRAALAMSFGALAYAWGTTAIALEPDIFLSALLGTYVLVAGLLSIARFRQLTVENGI